MFVWMSVREREFMWKIETETQRAGVKNENQIRIQYVHHYILMLHYWTSFWPCRWPTLCTFIYLLTLRTGYTDVSRILSIHCRIHYTTQLVLPLTHIRALSWASLCSSSVVPLIFSASPVHVFCLTVCSLSSFLPLCSTLNHHAPTQNSPAAEQRNNRPPQDLKRQEAELAGSRVPMLICMLHFNHTFIW
jgi:hypothetical protein